MATAKFNFVDETPGVVIPLNTLVGSTRDPRVFVINDGQAHERTLTITYVSEGKVKVRKGLSEGDLLVTSGQSNLKDGMQVKVID